MTCKVVHLGAKNTQANYTLEGASLVEAVKENNLLCLATANKTRTILPCIKRGIHSRDNSLILPLYKILVQPQLEYASLGTNHQE